MGTRFLKEGEDFSFPPGFGFTGSSSGNVNPRQHPTMDQDEFGDGTALSRMAAGPQAMASGGAVHNPPKAAKAVLGALQVGEALGEKKAALAGGQPPMAAPAARQHPPIPITRGPMPPAMMASGGAVNDDMGLYDEHGEGMDHGMGPGTYSRISKSQAEGRQAGTKDYDRIKRVQDASVQPVRAVRKAADYVGEKYGDVRDSVRSAVSGDPSDAEFRAGQRDVRQKKLGYAKGGDVKKAEKPSGSSDVRSPTSTDVRSPTRTSTSTKADTRGNVTVTGGAGDGDTSVSISPKKGGKSADKAKGGFIHGR